MAAYMRHGSRHKKWQPTWNMTADMRHDSRHETRHPTWDMTADMRHDSRYETWQPTWKMAAEMRHGSRHVTWPPICDMTADMRHLPTARAASDAIFSALRLSTSGTHAGVKEGRRKRVFLQASEVISCKYIYIYGYIHIYIYIYIYMHYFSLQNSFCSLCPYVRFLVFELGIQKRSLKKLYISLRLDSFC